MITFIITHEEYSKTYECSLTDSIEYLKDKIKKDFKLGDKYIDLYFDIEKPIRVLGQFNLEPGLSPRTMDRYTFDRYGIDGREINAHFEIAAGYQPFQVKAKAPVNLNKYSKPIESGESYEEKTFDIQSEDDFPALC
uniref:Uncharacterized protein n=1 Tax=viral metagenome TaxID=1070528 RepID=A0A6C0L1C9_9ZZZZ|tara:strand:+ start:12296 stop:12706 length:411 start_codon:yes stop_codon:yes gene_type:complete